MIAMSREIKKLQGIFTRLLQLVTAVAGLLLSAFPYPASFYAWPKVLVLGSWIVSYLWIRPNSKPSKIVLAISLAIGIGCGITYWVLIDSMTITVEDKVYIRGELTDDAQEYLKKKPSVTEKEYFIQSGKKEDWVWKPKSRRKPRITLGLLYSAFIFFFGLSIMGALEIYSRSEPQSENSEEESDDDDKPSEEESDDSEEPSEVQ